MSKLHYLGAGLVGLSTIAVYACSSSSSGTTTPPVKDASSDAVSGDGGPMVACSSLPGTIVYIESGDTQEPLLEDIGRKLRNEANITLVYELTGSCTVTPDLYSAVPIPANTPMLYIPSTAENATWTDTDPEYQCNITTPVAPDLGISALFPSSCPDVSPPASIGQWVGPAQAYTLVVPNAENTNEKAITAEEAYYAFGFGATNPVLENGMADNWNDPTQFYLRPTTKSTLVSTALNIGLTPNQLAAVSADGGTADGRQILASSGDVVTAVAAATSPKAIGILGVSVFDADRSAGIKVLAFQDFGQNAAYLPDSTPTSYDKQNVRDGHYTMWSPAVFIAPQTGNEPTNPAVKYLVQTLLNIPGVTPPGGLTGAPIDGIEPQAFAAEVPACAMQVTRTADGSPLTAYTPPNPCTCKFLSLVTNPVLPASCTTCTSNAQCTAAGTLGCFNGYCESPPAPSADGGTDCSNSGPVDNRCSTATSYTKNLKYPGGPDGGLEAPPL